MSRIVPTLILALLVLAPAPATARQEGTATPGATPLADPDAIVTALEEADPPNALPGNVDAEIELLTWEEHYGEPLEGSVGAWVLTGSNQFPIASAIIFPSAENAETGLGDFSQDAASVPAGPLEGYAVADRGKWLCLATDGPVLFIGQAEPVTSDEDENAVRDRACGAVAATHAWVTEAVTGIAPATPAGSPGD